MHPIKELLIKRNGMYCMLCGKKCTYKQINWHHIKPKWYFRKRKQKIDNSYENTCLVCIPCHKYIHTFKYFSDEYQTLMVAIQSHKK